MAGDEPISGAEWDEHAVAAAFPEGPVRAMTQDEIDSLFGSAVDATEKTAIEKILNAGLVLYERLPMLDVVLDRLTRHAASTLRQLLGVNVELFIEGVSTVRFGSYLDSVPLPAVLGVFRAHEWDGQGLVVVDPSLVYSIVDISLGGRRAAPARIEGRPFTSIARGLVEKLIDRLLEDLSLSFLPLCAVTLKCERLETNPRAASISSVSSAAVNVRLRIEAGDRSGTIQLLLPYATLEPVREILIQQFMGEKFGRDTIWENHLREELWATEVELEALLDERTMPLAAIASLNIGDRLELDVNANEPVTLRCATARVFTGRLGRKGNRVAVRLEGRAA